MPSLNIFKISLLPPFQRVVKGTIASNRHLKRRSGCYSANRAPFATSGCYSNPTAGTVAVPAAVSNGGRDTLSLQNNIFYV